MPSFNFFIYLWLMERLAWDRWDLLPGSARLGSAARQTDACTQSREPATAFDAPLAPEANEITAGGMELTLSLTDLQIPAG